MIVEVSPFDRNEQGVWRHFNPVHFRPMGKTIWKAETDIRRNRKRS